MSKLVKITKDNYSRGMRNPIPIFAQQFNVAVDQINVNTDGLASLVAKDGSVVSVDLITAGVTTADLALTVAGVLATNKVVVTIVGGTNTQGIPVILKAVCTADTITVTMRNIHATEALNGTLLIAYHLI